uniref:Uncharacterized protein n=1 Tax=Glossina palpalis gambiensis TaxID=67801 RepID=A0A1B0B656_9MUSC
MERSQRLHQHADECNTGTEFRAITLPKIIASRKEQSPASNKATLLSINCASKETFLTGASFNFLALPILIKDLQRIQIRPPPAIVDAILPFPVASIHFGLSCNEFICVSRPRIMPLYCATSADASELRVVNNCMAARLTRKSYSSKYPIINVTFSGFLRNISSWRSFCRTWTIAGIPWAPTSTRYFRDRALRARQASRRSSNSVADAAWSTSFSTVSAGLGC